MPVLTNTQACTHYTCPAFPQIHRYMHRHISTQIPVRIYTELALLQGGDLWRALVSSRLYSECSLLPPAALLDVFAKDFLRHPHIPQSATHQRQLGARAMKILYHGAILMAHVLQLGPPPLPTFHPLGNWLSPSPVPVTSLLDGGPGRTTSGGGKFVDEAPLWADRGEDRLCLEPFCTWICFPIGHILQ